MQNFRPPISPAIDLLRLWQLVWRARWLVILVTAVFFAAGVAYVVLAKPWYKAEIVIMPSESKPLSGGLSQLGGLANLAGINLGSSGNAQLALAVLKSKEFARSFIEQEGLINVIFEDKWDKGAGRWKSSDAGRQPDLRDAVRVFDESIRTVYEEKKTGVVTLSIVWTNAAVAAQWAGLMVERLNAHLRQDAMTEATKNIEYLQAEMARTSILPLQQSIGRVLESEMQKSLVARASSEYAYKIIDHPFVPKKAVRPNRRLVLAGAALAGLLAAIAFVLFRDMAK